MRIQVLSRLLGCGVAVSLGVFASGSSSEPAGAEIAFDRFEVLTGPARRQTVLAGFLLGGSMADLAVVHVDEDGDRRLRIYGFEKDAWGPKVDTRLRPDVSFVDVAGIGGRDRLIAYGRGRLSWFDPESKTQRELLAVSSNFQPPRQGEIPHVDVSRDVNGDGRDDLVVPDEDGFRVFVQTEGGTFADPLMLGPPTDLSGILGADGYRYDPWSVSRIHEADVDRDGRVDLVFWNKDHFEVHLQHEDGTFAARPETFTTGVTFDSDDVFSLAAGDMTGKVLHSLADVNGDGVADLVVFGLEGRRPTRKRSAYEVHFGESAPNGSLAFAAKAGAGFRSEGRVQIGMQRLGGGPAFHAGVDGKDARPTVLMITTIETRHLEGSFWKRIKGAMGDDVRLGLEFYRMDDGRSPDRPSTVRTIALDGAPSHREPGWVPLEVVLRGGTHESKRTREIWPRAFNRTVLIGDVTGDGRPDLLMEAEFNDLHVYTGVAGPDLFALEPQTVKVSLSDEEYTWLADLNGDGKQDLLVHQPFTARNAHGAAKLPPGSEPHRLTVLIAR